MFTKGYFGNFGDLNGNYTQQKTILGAALILSLKNQTHSESLGSDGDLLSFHSRFCRSCANWFDVFLVLAGLADIYIIVSGSNIGYGKHGEDMGISPKKVEHGGIKPQRWWFFDGDRMGHEWKSNYMWIIGICSSSASMDCP